MPADGGGQNPCHKSDTPSWIRYVASVKHLEPAQPRYAAPSCPTQDKSLPKPRPNRQPPSTGSHRRTSPIRSLRPLSRARPPSSPHPPLAATHPQAARGDSGTTRPTRNPSHQPDDTLASHPHPSADGRPPSAPGTASEGSHPRPTQPHPAVRPSGRLLPRPPPARPALRPAHLRRGVGSAGAGAASLLPIHPPRLGRRQPPS